MYRRPAGRKLEACQRCSTVPSGSRPRPRPRRPAVSPAAATRRCSARRLRSSRSPSSTTPSSTPSRGDRRRSPRERSRSAGLAGRRWRSPTRGCVPGCARGRGLVCGALAITAGVADGFRHVAVDRLAATTSRSCSPGRRRGLVLLGARDAVALAPARRAAAATLRAAHATRSLRPRGLTARLAGRVRDHGHPSCPGAGPVRRPRPPVRARELHHERRTSAGGWYVPSRNRAAVIVVRPAAGPRPARAAARSPRLRGAALRPSRRGGERRRLQRLRLGRRRRPQGRRDVPAPRDPTSTQQRIGGLGLSVGGELMLEAAAEDARLQAVVSEGAASGRSPSTGTTRAPPRSEAVHEPRRYRHSRSRCFPTKVPHRA